MKHRWGQIFETPSVFIVKASALYSIFQGLHFFIAINSLGGMCSHERLLLTGIFFVINMLQL